MFWQRKKEEPCGELEIRKRSTHNNFKNVIEPEMLSRVTLLLMLICKVTSLLSSIRNIRQRSSLKVSLIVSGSGFDAINREDFPILAIESYPGKPLIYLDSAASSQKPTFVIESMNEVPASSTNQFYISFLLFSKNCLHMIYSIIENLTQMYIAELTPWR